MADEDASEESGDIPEKLSEVEISRKKFLKWSAYVAPTLLSVLISSSPASAATCNPNLCSPDTCGPDDPCGPDSCIPDF